MEDATKRLTTAGYIVGGAVIAFYLVAMALNFGQTGSSATEWARRLELLSGLEALAFAAAGAVLGTTVQRQARVQAEERAKQNQADAEKGRVLEATTKAKLEQVSTTAEVAASAGSFEEALKKELTELVDAASLVEASSSAGETEPSSS